VDGAGAGSKAYTLSVSGQTVATMQTASTGPVTIPWNTRNVADGSRALTASVRDAAGKTGSRSVTVTVHNGAVSSTPNSPLPWGGGLTVSVTQPANGVTVSGIHQAIVWVNGASAGAKVYTLSVAGQLVASIPTSSTGPVSIAWNTRTVADGSRALTASVRDAAGKTGSTSVTVNVHNGTAALPQPTTTGTLKLAITNPTSGATVGGTPSVVLWADGTSGSANTFTFSVDGATIGMQTVSMRGPVTIPWTTRSVVNGVHTLTATVRDATGNTGRTSFTVTVRN
jgi:hypothetical protein